MLMVLGTFANLTAMDNKTSGVVVDLADRTSHVIDGSPEVPRLVDSKLIDQHLNETGLLRLSPKIIVPSTLDKYAGNSLESVANQPPVIIRDPSALLPFPVKQADIAVVTTTPNRPISDIHHDAILHEEAEIAAEAKSNDGVVAGQMVQKTQDLVAEIKEELAKKNQETQNLVMQKLGDLEQHVKHIEQVQEDELAKSLHQHDPKVDVAQTVGQDAIQTVQQTILKKPVDANNPDAKPEVVVRAEEAPLIFPEYKDPIRTLMQEALIAQKRARFESTIIQGAVGPVVTPTPLEAIVLGNAASKVRAIPVDEKVEQANANVGSQRLASERAAVRDLLTVAEESRNFVDEPQPMVAQQVHTSHNNGL